MLLLLLVLHPGLTLVRAMCTVTTTWPSQTCSQAARTSHSESLSGALVVVSAGLVNSLPVVAPQQCQGMSVLIQPPHGREMLPCLVLYNHHRLCCRLQDHHWCVSA